MKKNNIITLVLFLGVFSCGPNFDNDTIAFIGNKKISKTSFHKYFPEVRYNALSDSLKVEKIKEFLAGILKKRDKEKLQIKNNPEIITEMSLWSKRTLGGLLFDRKILSKVFPQDSLKKIYNNVKIHKNISVIVIPYKKIGDVKTPNRKKARIIAEDIYNRSKIEEFADLQNIYSRVATGPNDKKSHWTRLFSGVKAVDRELWKYKVGDVINPIDDGQSFRIIKINAEKEDTKLPDYDNYKDILVKQVVELWGKSLQNYFIVFTDSLLKDASFFVDNKLLNVFSNELKNKIIGKNIINALENIDFERAIGKYNDIDLNRKWFLRELKKEENLFAYQLADPDMAYAFVKGLVISKVNYNTAKSMGLHNSPNFLEKYEEELNTRTNNFYDLNVYKKGLEITDSKMQKYYNDNKKDFDVPPKILAKSLWFNKADIAKSYYKKILSKENSFDKVFDYFRKNKNSLYGAERKYLRPTSSNDPYKLLFDLENGEISQPFKRGNKSYIIKIIEKVNAQERSFNEVKAQILMRLSKLNEKSNNEIARERLLRKYKVSINDSLI